MTRQFWPSDLIGRPGSRYGMVTPALVLDLDAAERNLAVILERLRTSGRTLRVNAKTHKSSHAAAFQIARGASGVSCATLGEAGAIADACLPGILITTPMTTAAKIEGVIDVARRASILLAVDDAENVAALSAAARRSHTELSLVVDVDAGFRRTGVANESEVLSLAQLIAASPAVHFAGIQCYAGPVQHVGSRQERKAQNDSVLARIERVIDLLDHSGLRPKVVSGGGTGTFDLDDARSCYTESQAGSFMFMDTQYLDVWAREPDPVPFVPALFVQAAVHSASYPGMVTTDAGGKRFSRDAGLPILANPWEAPTEFRFGGDEHGILVFTDGRSRVRVGDRVEFIPPHCDPTISLYDRIHCVRGDTLVDIWPLDAQGM